MTFLSHSVEIQSQEVAAAAAAAAKSSQSCPTLCDPIDSSPPGSPIPGILQARVLEWGAIAFSESTGLRGEKMKVKFTQSCPTLRLFGRYSP